LTEWYHAFPEFSSIQVADIDSHNREAIAAAVDTHTILTC